MPRFTLHDGTGTGYRIDTTDLSLVQAWLYHWTPRLVPNGPMTLTVRPVRDAQGVPDWPAVPPSYTERFEVAADPEVIMEQVARRREELTRVSFAGDLLVIVPSRGRPGSIARLLDAVHATAKMRTHVHVAVDDDDPELERYRYVMKQAAAEGDVLTTGPRKGLCAWTNEIAVEQAGRYPFLASFGDDHVPVTPGWDRALLAGIMAMGGTGFTYPWDSTREDIPEAVVVSSDIVQALGWFCLPELSHWYPDNVWADLGRGAGCIRHLRAVLVDHRQVATGKAPVDETAKDNGRSLSADRDAYYAWRRSGRMQQDIDTVVSLREARVPQPA